MPTTILIKTATHDESTTISDRLWLQDYVVYFEITGGLNVSEFGMLDLEEITGEADRLAGGEDFLDQFVPMPEVKPGATGIVVVRILPPVRGAKLYQYNRIHTLNERKMHCPKQLVGGKWSRDTYCPICDYYSDLWKQIDKLTKSGNVSEAEKLKKEARSIKPVERYYYNVIVRKMTVDGETKENVGPKILSVGKILHTMIIKAIIGEEGDPSSKLGNITDPKTGYDFVIRKEVTPGDGFPKYERSSFTRDPSPLGKPEQIEEWQKNLHDLTKLRNPRDKDYLEKELAIHRGLIPDEEEGFSTEKFDKKWKRSTESVVEQQVADVVNTSRSSSSAAPVHKEATKVVDDAPIENEDFLKELEQMDG